MILRNGLIDQVGTEVTVPLDAWVIDGAGLTVYPGFIDALSSWGIPNASPPAGVAGRVTAAAPTAATQPRVRGPEDRPQTYRPIAPPTW